MSLAPIVLFVYNRPVHTEKTIRALLKNELAAQSNLYIFADGAKDSADPTVQKVRSFIKSVKGFKSVIVHENQVNLGLAGSVISGVSQVIRQHGRVIVLEDDVVAHPGFLTFMNEALDLYQNDRRIGSIGAFTHRVLLPAGYPYDVFLAKRVCSWGWATWLDRFEPIDWAVSDYEHFKQDKKAVKKFSEAGTDLVEMLDRQQRGLIDSWAVRWQYDHYKKGFYIVTPVKSMVFNIGTDGSGVHYKSGQIEIDHNPLPESQRLKPNADVRPDHDLLKQYYNIYNIKKRKSPRSFLKRAVRALLPYKAVMMLSGWRAKRKKPAYGWFGNYKTYAAALAASGGYDAENILKSCSDSLMKVKNNEVLYERDRALFSTIQYSYPLLAALLKAGARGALNVIDFGGSLGSSYFQNRSMLAAVAKLRWNIVEQANFIEEGKKRFEDTVLRFHNSIDEALANGTPDFLLLSSVLPYLEDPYQFCEELLAYKFRYILIDRTFINPQGFDRITLQKIPEAIYQASYPAHLLSEKRLLAIFLPEYDLKTTFNSAFDTNCNAYDPDIKPFPVKGFWLERRDA
jgi:putative methyltransferase (TIGR04325 family)